MTDEERAGRIDIAWKTHAGSHIIVELKRPERIVTTGEVVDQVSKYQSALARVLRDVEDIAVSDIQTVVLVGRDLRDWNLDAGRQKSAAMLEQIRTRVNRYDLVLAQAQHAYREFLDQGSDLGRIVQLLWDIEASDLPSMEEDDVDRTAGTPVRPVVVERGEEVG